MIKKILLAMLLMHDLSVAMIEKGLIDLTNLQYDTQDYFNIIFDINDGRKKISEDSKDLFFKGVNQCEDLRQGNEDHIFTTVFKDNHVNVLFDIIPDDVFLLTERSITIFKKIDSDGVTDNKVTIRSLCITKLIRKFHLYQYAKDKEKEGDPSYKEIPDDLFNTIFSNDATKFFFILAIVENYIYTNVLRQMSDPFSINENKKNDKLVLQNILSQIFHEVKSDDLKEKIYNVFEACFSSINNQIESNEDNGLNIMNGFTSKNDKEDLLKEFKKLKDRRFVDEDLFKELKQMFYNQPWWSQLSPKSNVNILSKKYLLPCIPGLVVLLLAQFPKITSSRFKKHMMILGALLTIGLPGGAAYYFER